MVARGLAARGHLEPGDLREGDPRLARLRRGARRARAPGLRGARDLPPPWRSRTCSSRPTCCARSGTSTGGADGYVSLEVAPRLAHDTEGTLEQAREYWGLVDRPNADDQDPRHRRGRARDRAGDLRGHQRQRDAAVRGRGVRARSPRPTSAGWSAAATRASRSTLHSVASFFVSRVDTEVDKRLEALGNTELQGTAGGRERARRLHALQGDLPRRALRRAARGRRAGAAAAVGLDRRQEPALPGDEVRRRAGGAGHRQHDADADAARVRRARRGHGRDRGRRPGEVDAELQALADAGIDMATSRPSCCATASSSSTWRCDKLLDGDRARRARRSSPGGPTRSRRRSRTSWSTPLAERVQRASQEDVARRIWRRDESLWGGPGVPEIGNRLGWLTIAETMLEERGRSSRRSPREWRAEGLTDAVLLGMGGSSLAPEVIRRSFGDDGRARCACTCSTRPTRARSSPSSSAVDLEQTLFIVSSKSGGTIETLSLTRYFESRLQRGGDGEHFVGDHRSGQPAGASWRRSTASGACSSNDPDIGGRYSRAVVLRARARRRWRAWTSRRCSSARRWPSSAARTTTQRRGQLRACGSALVIGELALQGRDKLTFVVDEPIASFGLWVEQLVAESTGKQGRGILPVADEPLGAPESTATTACSSTCATSTSPTTSRTPAIEALARPATRRSRWRCSGAADLGAHLLLRRVRDRGGRLGARDQPVRPAERAGGEGQHRARARRYARSDGCRSAGRRTTRCGRCSTRSSRRTTSRSWATSRPRSEFDAAVSELRARDPGRHAVHHDVRLRPALPALHRAVPQGRPADRAVPPARPRRRRGRGDPGRRLHFAHLKNAQAIGDLQTLRDHGLPPSGCGSRATRAARASTDSRIKEML